MSINTVFATKYDASGLRSAEKSIGQFSKNVKSVIGGLGLVSLFSGVSRVMKDAAKNAIDDAKSQAILAGSLRNSVSASDETIASVEKQIGVWQRQTSVLDDTLRPAYSAAVRAMGDVTKANKLMDVALDVSAGTGKDLTLVVKSISRALDGNVSGLQRLVPGIKVTDDVLGSLKTQFGGLAVAAANTDPLKRMEVVMNDLSERIGTYLLPALDALAQYLASDDFAAVMESVFKGFDKIGLAIDTVIQKVPGLKGAFDSLGQSMANGDWVKGIPILGAYIDILSKLNPNAGKTAAPSAFQIAQHKGLVPDKKLYVPPVPKLKTPKAPTTKASKKQAAADFAAKKLAAEQAAAKEAADAAKKLAEEIKRLKDELRSALSTSFKDLLAKEVPAMGEFEQKVSDTFTSIKETILGADTKILADKQKAIFAGLAEFAQQQLSKIAKKRDELAMKIENAKSFMETVKDAVFGQVNINELGRSSKAIILNFQKIITRTLEFKKNISALQQAGLGTDALKQIIEGGVDAGGATAQALLRGGAGAISEVNSLFGQLTNAASGISETAGQIMFGSGVDLSNGLVAGLLSQEEQLKMAADTLATAFQTQFNKRLGLGKADTGFINVAGKSQAGTVINLTVNAPMGTGNSIGKLIIDEISKFERTSGMVFARA